MRRFSYQLSGGIHTVDPAALVEQQHIRAQPHSQRAGHSVEPPHSCGHGGRSRQRLLKRYSSKSGEVLHRRKEVEHASRNGSVARSRNAVLDTHRLTRKLVLAVAISESVISTKRSCGTAL